MVLFISIFTIIANLYLGLLVFFRNPKSLTHRLFLLFTVSVAVWAAANYFSLYGDTPDQALSQIRVTLAAAVIMFTLLYFFSINFPLPNRRFSLLHLGAIVVFSLFVVYLSFTNLVFRGVTIQDGIITPIPNAGILLYAISVIGFPLASFVILTRKFRSAVGRPKEQLRFLSYGITIAFIFAIITNFILVNVLKITSLVVFGPFFTLVFVSFSAYAMLRYQLLDIKPIVARITSFVVLIAALAIFYFLAIFFSLPLLGLEIDRTLSLLLVFLAVPISLAFQAMYNLIKRYTDKFFFKGAYDPSKVLSRLTRIMAGTIELDLMTMDILKTLAREMRLAKVAFLIMDERKISDIKNFGFQDGNLAGRELEKLFSEPQINTCYIFEDLKDGALKDFFRGLDISIAMPIYVEREPAAILILGPKLSGEIYFQKDLDLLNIFSAEAGIAIRNAKAYEEIKQFSGELEKRVEERTKELKEAQGRELQEAREVSRLKDEFVFVAAHELRTPVTIIKGFLDLVSTAGHSFPKDVKRHLDIIASASDNLGQLIGDLLEIARSETGTMKVTAESVNVSEIINITVKEMLTLARKCKIKIKVMIPEVIPMVLGDTPKIKEVLANLLSNAIKYNKEKGLVNVSVFAKGDYLFIEVQDTGYGIPENARSKIFQKFFRSFSKETQEVMGTGLGLFISRMLVEKMGGKITFSSVEGQGSTFSFSLPVDKK